MAASFSVIFTILRGVVDVFTGEYLTATRWGIPLELPGSQQIANKPSRDCRGGREKEKGLEIYANASVNKRNEARCINSCSMSGKGDSFCTVGAARKMSGRKPPFLRNLRRVRKRARQKGEKEQEEEKCTRERERGTCCRRLVTSLVLVKKFLLGWDWIVAPGWAFNA